MYLTYSPTENYKSMKRMSQGNNGCVNKMMASFQEFYDPMKI